MSEEWEHPWTGKMPVGWAPTEAGETLYPTGYVVPPAAPMETHDHNPPPVRKTWAVELGAPYSGEGMKHTMDEVWTKVKAQSPPSPGDGEQPEVQQSDPVFQSPAYDGNPKHAAGSAKAPLHLVPASALIYEALVFELGAKKYGQFNWRDSAVVRSIYLDAAMRHLLALMDGQDLDEESGYPHEAHVRACMAIIIDAKELGKLIDDRNTGGNVAEILKRYTKPRGYPFDGAR